MTEDNVHTSTEMYLETNLWKSIPEMFKIVHSERLSAIICLQIGFEIHAFLLEVGID